MEKISTSEFFKVLKLNFEFELKHKTIKKNKKKNTSNNY